MWKRNAKDPIAPVAEELIAECEAVHTGRYAELLSKQGGRVPPWAWVNALAHRTEAELAELARGDDDLAYDMPDSDRPWRLALAFVADDMLRHVQAAGGSVAAMQRATLVPLELDLVRTGDYRVQHPGHLATIVMAAVRRHPTSHTK